MIAEELIKDLQVLNEIGFVYELVEDGLRIYVVFRNYPLPPLIYNIDKTDLLIFTTAQYPNAGFDMFWTDERLMLKNNGIPKNAESIETYIGKRWRRFSYHPFNNNKHWNPSMDSVISYISYIDQRLNKGD